MGVLAALQQNQQDPQPRERDYFYAGSFLVWCLWIGIGAFNLIESLAKYKFTSLISTSIIAGSLILVPVNMAIGGWKIHSRAGNYLPFDYSYNILQSVEKDAILFTNGDNDTFPVWWIQDVAGVRRDVRIVNLSLGNTLWYVDQLKNRQPWGASKLPLSFTDESVQKDDENQEGALSYDFGEARNIDIPVKKEILAKYTNDTNIINQGSMKFTWLGKPYREMEGKQIYIFRVQDKLVLDILQQVKFERPVYFSTTVGPDAFCGLENNFRYEGMAMRICPVPQKKGGVESIDANIMSQCLMNVDNSNNYSTEPKYGFKFRNLNNPSIYYDEVHRRLMSSYRSLYLTFAAYQMTQKKSKEAIVVLNKMQELISDIQFPLSFDVLFRLAKIYDEAGAKEQAIKYAKMGTQACENLIQNQNLGQEYIYYEAMGRQIGPFNVAAMLYELMGDYDNSIRILKLLGEEIQKISGAENQDQRVLSNYYGTLRDIKRYEVLNYLKKNGLQATTKFVADIIAELEKSPSQENAFYIRAYNEAIQEITSKNTNDTTKIL